jgi:hypothetical protein
MDLTKILTISGKSGLFNLVAQTKTGAIVESFTDKKRFPVFANEKMNSLEEISIFTTDEDKPLKEVLELMFKKENGGPASVDKENSAALKAYLEEVLPDYDKERVYVSDIKKLITWYMILHKEGLLEISEPETTEEAEKTEDPGTGEETDVESNS